MLRWTENALEWSLARWTDKEFAQVPGEKKKKKITGYLKKIADHNQYT